MTRSVSIARDSSRGRKRYWLTAHVLLLCFWSVNLHFGVSRCALAQTSPGDSADPSQMNGAIDLGAAISLYDDLEYEQALSAFTRVLENPALIASERVRALRYLALSAQALGKTAEARAALVQILALDRAFVLPQSDSEELRLLLESARAELPPEPTKATIESTISPTAPIAGAPITVKIVLSGDTGEVRKVAVLYRAAGQVRYSRVVGRRKAVQNSSGSDGAGAQEKVYLATISGMSVTAVGLEYRVVAERADGSALIASDEEPIRIAVGVRSVGSGGGSRTWLWVGLGALAIAGVATAIFLAKDSGGGKPSDTTAVRVTVLNSP